MMKDLESLQTAEQSLLDLQERYKIGGGGGGGGGDIYLIVFLL